MVIKLSLRNIRNTFKNFKKIFCLLVISQLIAVILIYFAYGIYCNYNESLQEVTIDSYTIMANFSEEESSEFGELKECFNDTLLEVEDRLNFFYILASDEDKMINIHNEYHDGKFFISKEVAKNVIISEGYYLSDEDVSNGKNVIAAHSLGNVDDEVEIAGIKYKIVGIIEQDDTETKCLDIPYAATPDSVRLRCIILNFKKLPRQSDYVAFKDSLESKFGDKVQVDEFKLKDVEEITSIHSIMIFAIAISVITGVDTCLLFGYIISRRKKQSAVLELVGGKRINIFTICELEVMIISLLDTIIGFIFYKICIEERLQNMYGNAMGVYSRERYLIISVIYLLSILLITSIMVWKHTFYTVKEMLRRATND